MATIEFIQKRIAGKEKKIEKLEKKLARIRKVEAQNWEDPNPYFYTEYDLKWCLKDLENANKQLADYKAQLQSETEKAASRDVKVILEFLENWKDNVRAYYQEKFPKYLAAREAYWAEEKEYIKRSSGLRWSDEEEYDRLWKEHREYQKAFGSKWAWIRQYVSHNDFLIDELNKDLNNVANRKYDFIIERTNHIVGQITDASALTIGNKSDLNGYIVGTKGTAHVQTIGAGGWGNGNGWGGSGSNTAIPFYSQSNDFSNLERENDIIRQDICQNFASVNQTLANGFQGIQTSFANAELSRSNTQAALMQQMYNSSLADVQARCELNANIANGFAQTNYNAADQGCSTRNTIQSSTRDIIDSQNAGTNAILNALTAQRIEDKNAQIADLTMRLNNATLMSSQAAQTNQLQNYVSGQFAYYNPRPVPAFNVPTPYQFGGGFGPGFAVA